MAAFVAARKAGAQWIETDVKITADGVPVLFHDDRLERTTNGQGTVADTNWDEMRQLDAGAWFGAEHAGARVPTLAELLIFARESGVRLNLELKPCQGRAQATVMVALIEAANLWPENLPPPLLSSFDIDALLVAAQLRPDWPRGLLLSDWPDNWRETAARAGVSSLHVDAALLTPERIEMLRQTGLPLLSFTVNDPAKARQLLQDGVRAVFSDDPGSCISSL